MSSIFFLLFFLFTIQTYAQNICTTQERVFYFNMPIIIGDKIFNDQVEICKINGKYKGELKVPKRFKAALENIQYANNKLSFSITANEGSGPFQVFYAGEIKESKYFMGLAHLKGKKLLGPFIGVASDKEKPFEIIQTSITN